MIVGSYGAGHSARGREEGLRRTNGGDGLHRRLGKHGGCTSPDLESTWEKVGGSREINSKWRCGRGT